jgi:uncharacterized sulfatase
VAEALGGQRKQQPGLGRRVRLRAARFGLLALVALGGCDPEPRRDGPPNFVVIISDDHGYRDFGFMGSPRARTPELDRLAASGTVFRTAYAAASVCAPSLTALLTGIELDQWDRGVAELAARGVVRPPATRIQFFGTIPRWLGERGYRSLQAGKFWSDRFERAGFTHGTKRLVPGDPPLVRHAGGSFGLAVGRTTMQPVFDFIDAQRAVPFLVWFAPQLPHRPYDAPARFRAPYSDPALGEAARGHYANVSRLDAAVGELLRHLERRGLRERTLVVFCADNGFDVGAEGDAVLPPLGGPKGKFSMYELGFRTPLVFSWPGVVPAGVVRDDLVSLLDLAPTLLAFAGVDPLPAPLQGRSLLPALLEGSPVGRERLHGHVRSASLPREEGAARGAEGSRGGPASFLRDRRWHYVWYPEAGVEQLFDVEADPLEERDVASEHPERVAGFRRDVEAWRRSLREESPPALRPEWVRAAEQGGLPGARRRAVTPRRSRAGAGRPASARRARSPGWAAASPGSARPRGPGPPLRRRRATRPPARAAASNAGLRRRPARGPRP